LEIRVRDLTQCKVIKARLRREKTQYNNTRVERGFIMSVLSLRKGQQGDLD